MQDLMSVRDFCARVGLSPHTVRYYERAGLVPRGEWTIVNKAFQSFPRG